MSATDVVHVHLRCEGFQDVLKVVLGVSSGPRPSSTHDTSHFPLGLQLTHCLVSFSQFSGLQR